MAQDDIHRLALISTQDNTEMVNTFWFREADNLVAPDQRATLANLFAGVAITPATNSFRQCVTSNVTFTAITVQRYRPFETGVFTLPLIANNVGILNGANYLPAIVAQCITILTSLGGRSGRGRFYLPPPQNTNIAQGLWNTNQINALNNAMSSMNNNFIQAGGIAANGLEWGVWSRKLAGPTPPYSLAGFHKITGWLVRPQPRALSRRTHV